MSELSKAEIHRRQREWLRVECPDPEFNTAFEAAKRAVDDPQTLIAVGDWSRAHGRLEGVFETPAGFNNIIDRFVFETLGYQPDPEKGRLRLRPDFPADWDFARIDNIRVGDALVTMSFRRDDVAVRYELEQIAGAMPVRLIFEPVLRDKFDRVTIDGHAAELNIAVVGDAVVAPVQLMLDAKRVVEFG